MAKLVSRIMGWLRPSTLAGIDKSGNRYFTRTEDMDGALKERRLVKFKSDSDPTTLPVEWISWLTGQRKEAPTPQEMLELEAQRERVKMNAAILQKEEEKRRFRAKSLQQSMDSGDVGPPNLARFIQDFSDASIAHDEGGDAEKISHGTHENADRVSEPVGTGSSFRPGTWQPPESSEPTGTGQSFQPGTWQPPK